MFANYVSNLINAKQDYLMDQSAAYLSFSLESRWDWMRIEFYTSSVSLEIDLNILLTERANLLGKAKPYQ